jgi:hypothetical protein
MSKTLGGSLFIRNGDKFDYCYKESIKCLLEFCDKVSVCVCTGGFGDNTHHEVWKIKEANPDKMIVRFFADKEWEEMSFHGKYRLSIFTNYAIEMLDTDYVFNLQGDEIVDPSSYPYIRQAMEEGFEGYVCERVNLWGSPYTQLNVPQERKPCSTEIVRLAKAYYRAYDDAESLAAQSAFHYMSKIKIWHMGFVRKREVHPAKIREMQGNIFKCGVDSKLEGMEVFDSTKWFSGDDLIPIQGELPPLIQQWAKERQ